jgi:GDP-L-fucose synthase
MRAEGFTNLLTRASRDLDLRKREAVDAFFATERPHYVFLAAARVGGIHANSTCGAEFLYDNLLIQTHVIDAAYRFGVRKLLYFGSSCIYPRTAPQPLREDTLLSGPLEPTNAPYAVAKIAGIHLCQAYRRQFGFRAICAMPANLYGPHDSFDLKRSHVLPALIRKFYEGRAAAAPAVTVWGSGTPRREFLHVDDLADAALLLMRSYDDSAIINVGTGDEIAIADLARLVARASGFAGRVEFDGSKPDGVPRKVLDITRMAGLGWKPKIALTEGVRATCEWYATNAARGTQASVAAS